MAEQDIIKGLEAVAYRRLVRGLADVDDDDEWTDMNPIERVDAAVESITELKQENMELRQRVAELEAASGFTPENKEYKEMTRAERVRLVRTALLRQAKKQRSGKAQFDYKDVQLLFDSHPSAAYAYKLMELAGKEDGFSYTKEGKNRIRVKTDSVKDETLFHGANNETSWSYP